MEVAKGLLKRQEVEMVFTVTLHQCDVFIEDE
jgi:hypothetical protein